MSEKNDIALKSPTERKTPESLRGGVHFPPAVDIYETEKELILHADVPGVGPEDVDLRYERGELVLHGHLKPRQRAGSLLASEYEEGDFYRVFQVHESIDAAHIEATCKNGVLTVTLPKEKAAQPRKIAVKSI